MYVWQNLQIYITLLCSDLYSDAGMYSAVYTSLCSVQCTVMRLGPGESVVSEGWVSQC